MIRFKKIYSRVDDYGVAYSSIILFYKHPILFKSEDMGNGMMRTVPSQYAYRLVVDLFFFIFDLNWESKEK